MKYTKTEIKFYETLAEILLVHNEMMETFSDNIFGYSKQNKKELNKWVSKMVDNLININKILIEAKIPKKFLILNKLRK